MTSSHSVSWLLSGLAGELQASVRAGPGGLGFTSRSGHKFCEFISVYSRYAMRLNSHTGQTWFTDYPNAYPSSLRHTAQTT